MRFQTVHTPTSLTEGPISQALISFALPLLLGNLFQQLYNTADSLITFWAAKPSPPSAPPVT